MEFSGVEHVETTETGGFVHKLFPDFKGELTFASFAYTNRSYMFPVNGPELHGVLVLTTFTIDSKAAFDDT